MTPYTYCPVCSTKLAPTEINGAERLKCPSCGFVHWDNPTPVVAAVVERKGHVVLVQSIGWPKEFYGLVTGFLEKNEDPAEAVLREVKEEIGLEAEMGKFLGLYTFFRRNQLIIAYHVIAHEGEIQLQESELAAYKEVPIEKVRPWPSSTGYALNDWLVEKGYNPKFLEFPSRK